MDAATGTEAALLAAAAELFAHRGFHATSLRAIAVRANLTTRAVHSRLPGGKSELLVRLAADFVSDQRPRSKAPSRSQTVAFLAAALAADHDLEVASAPRKHLPAGRSQRAA